MAKRNDPELAHAERILHASKTKTDPRNFLVQEESKQCKVSSIYQKQKKPAA